MRGRAGQYNTKNVLRKVARSTKFKRASLKNAQRKFDIERDKLVNNFKNHPVTKEIEGGAGASNTSNTLGGRGNLFTYIGFVRGSNPVSSIEKILRTSGSVKPKRKAQASGRGIRQEFIVKGPSEELLMAASVMPFQNGRSWLFDIETGISGFNYYLYKRFIKGRSGRGLQTKNPVRGGSYRPPSTGYIRRLLNQFYTSFKK